MRIDELTDDAAIAEARRLFKIVNDRRRILDRWMGLDDALADNFNPQSGFCMGMLSLFRYARGMDVPPFIVRDFIDELLKLMFSGLANNTIALPPFRRMKDKPWAIAWRGAELRLALDGGEEIEVSALAHLMGISEHELRQEIAVSNPDFEDVVPRRFLSELFEAMKETV